mgnify:CR=1 FL=1
MITLLAGIQNLSKTMKRRKFTGMIATGLGTLAIVSPVHAAPTTLKKIKKPARLKRGDKVGLITPGSYIGEEGFQEAINNIESLGLKVELGKHVRAKRGYTAGTDEERLSDLHTMFSREDISAIWCARGGYGCSRLLPNIDYKLIQKNPKLLIGYSDITALLNAIFEQTGLVGIHGPVGASKQTDYTLKHFQSIVMNPENQFTIKLSQANQEEEDPLFKPFVIRPGRAEGDLVGGNLSLLAAMAGTDYQPKVKGRLVFIEDVGEKPYRVDRMLTQLRQAYALDEAAGLALGIFAGCEADEDDDSLSLRECLEDRLGGLGIPVMYGFSFGHISNQCSLPVGVKAIMDTTAQTITLMESAVE